MMETIKLKLAGALRSFTVWFNTVLLVLLPIVEIAKETLPELEEFLTPGVYRTIGLVVVVANILLRFRTTQPLEMK